MNQSWELEVESVVRMLGLAIGVLGTRLVKLHAEGGDWRKKRMKKQNDQFWNGKVITAPRSLSLIASEAVPVATSDTTSDYKEVTVIVFLFCVKNKFLLWRHTTEYTQRNKRIQSTIMLKKNI